MARPKRKPDFVVRAADSLNRNWYNTVGSAWNGLSDNGVPYISIRLFAIPVDFDGRLMLIEVSNGDDDPVEIEASANGE